MIKKTSEIKSREDFSNFLSFLIESLKNNPSDWSNFSLTEFLEAAKSWTEDMDGYYENLKIKDADLETGSWRVFADILMAARIYE